MNQPQLFVEIDRDKLKAQKVSLDDVNLTLQAYLGGLYVNDVTLFNRNWQVNVQADARFRMRVEDIGRLEVRNAEGQRVPLRTLVDVRDDSGPAIVNHYNGYPSAELSGNMAPGTSSGQAVNIMDEITTRVAAVDHEGRLDGESRQSSGHGGNAARPAAVVPAERRPEVGTYRPQGSPRRRLPHADPAWRLHLRIAGREVLAHVCRYDHTRLRTCDVRFSGAGISGEHVETQIWVDGDIVSFRARSVEMGRCRFGPWMLQAGAEPIAGRESLHKGCGTAALRHWLIAVLRKPSVLPQVGHALARPVRCVKNALIHPEQVTGAPDHSGGRRGCHRSGAPGRLRSGPGIHR